MKNVYIDGKRCIGPTFSRAEFALIKRNLGQQRGLETLAEMLNVAGSVPRLRILYLLHAHKEMCVCDLAEILNMTDSAISQHLRKMKDKNLVQWRRQGQTIYYSLQDNIFVRNIQDMFGLEETREPLSFMHKEMAR